MGHMGAQAGVHVQLALVLGSAALHVQKACADVCGEGARVLCVCAAREWREGSLGGAVHVWVWASKRVDVCTGDAC